MREDAAFISEFSNNHDSSHDRSISGTLPQKGCYMPDGLMQPEARVYEDHLLRKLRAHISRLKPKDQEIVDSRINDGLSFDTIATRLDCSAENVRRLYGPLMRGLIEAFDEVPRCADIIRYRRQIEATIARAYPGVKGVKRVADFMRVNGLDPSELVHSSKKDSAQVRVDLQHWLQSDCDELRDICKKADVSRHVVRSICTKLETLAGPDHSRPCIHNGSVAA